MYLGADVGGTKTLLAALDEQGAKKATRKFPTPKDYQEFLSQFGAAFNELKADYELSAGAIGIPGFIDRTRGVGLMFGNLPWKDIAIKQDLESLTGISFLVENDAKTAALYEADWL